MAMDDGPTLAMSVLGVYMRREGITSITVTYAELAAQPIQVMIEQTEDGAVIVTYVDALTEAQKATLQRQARTLGQSFTTSLDVDALKSN